MTESTQDRIEGESAEKSTGRRRSLIGVVKSDKMDKTRVVVVERRTAHSKYGKFVSHRSTYKVHDEKNETKAGDRVEIVECRPMSRDKRWRLARLIERPAEV